MTNEEAETPQPSGPSATGATVGAPTCPPPAIGGAAVPSRLDTVKVLRRPTESCTMKIVPALADEQMVPVTAICAASPLANIVEGAKVANCGAVEVTV